MKNKEKYDLTKLKIKWKDGESIEVFDKENKLFSAYAYTYTNKYLLESYLEWLEAEYKEPILGEKEKEYLSAVIRPWRDKVKNISKKEYPGKYVQYQYIAIRLKTGEEDVCLPNFQQGTMYKGMELVREYSIEDLGL